MCAQIVAFGHETNRRPAPTMRPPDLLPTNARAIPWTSVKDSWGNQSKGVGVSVKDQDCHRGLLPTLDRPSERACSSNIVTASRQAARAEGAPRPKRSRCGPEG